MKKIKTKNLTKQIICIIIVLMLCNFIIPSSIYAAQEEDSGTIFAPFFKFVTFLCDSIMQFMQNAFTSPDKIEVQEGVWNFKYSPAIIFSGTVPAFDINFVNPSEGINADKTSMEFVSLQKALEINGAKKIKYAMTGMINDIKKDEQYEYNETREIDISLLEGNLKSSEKMEPTFDVIDNELKCAWYNAEQTKIYVILYYEQKAAQWDEGLILYEINTREALNNATKITGTVTEIVIGTQEYGSISQDLQPVIATWYNALRRISLVGLLSVLIYVGIQVVLSSASGKENSKYKKMLVDWLIAICLLFTLHYIMNVTIVITEKISSILNNGETDTLLNTLRSEIEQGETWEQVTSQVIMYIVMTIFTVMFTFQYLKRVLYIGFFTIIAPLITLTYPLDKIKDSKAQAFTMWIREYIFTALIQVVHLVVYYALVGSALSLVEAYPLYGVLAIAFITQGEKIIRKMFGFDNVTTVGTMGAAATGGLVATALNKLQKVSKPSKKEEGSNNNIRTTSNSVTTNLNGNGSGSNSGPSIKGGAKSLAGRYFLPTTKAVAGATLKTLAGIPGAMLGFATGISQGDISAALTGAVAGGKVGTGLGQKLANGVSFGNIKNSINNVQDTFNEGAYGKEYAQNIRMVRDFKQTKEYKELKDEFGDTLTDEKLSEILNAARKEQGKQ